MLNLLKKLFPGLFEEPKVKNTNVHKRAVCIGINDYPGTNNDLRGCVNDAQTWAELLQSKYGFDTPAILLNKAATHDNVSRAINKQIKRSQPGDTLVITYSGHGTSVPDKDGDEFDGRDEAICLYDNLMIDDELRNMFRKIRDGVNLTVISDSCHSGSVTRGMFTPATLKSRKDNPVVKYMPPENDTFAKRVSSLPIRKIIFGSKKSIRSGDVSEEQMLEVLITGCKSTEYSYDASLGGKFMGAMSYYATNILKKNPNLTYEEFYTKLTKQLPSREYPQSPQLEGKSGNKKKKIFS